MADEENPDVDHLLVLADLVHLVEKGDASPDVISQIQSTVVSKNMYPYYDTFLSDIIPFTLPGEILEEMRLTNDTRLEELEAAIVDAQDNFGESEVREANHQKAQYLQDIGSKAAALRAWKETILKTVDLGRKIDIVFGIIRLGFALRDLEIVRNHVARAKKLIARGGDWDRRNRLKVYEGFYLAMCRRFPEACEELLGAISTFGAYRLCTFRRFIQTTLLVGLLVLDRPKLKAELIDSPDVLTVVDKTPHVRDLVHHFYQCQYGLFLQRLLDVESVMRKDRYMSAHIVYYSREVRIRAYSQFLQAYKSVTMASMADNFGVSFEFLDRELSRFISFGRLNAKIDRVDEVINTTRPKRKNAQYGSIMKRGDALLGRLQKLSRVVDL